jgi:hypothetical protein
MDRQDFEILEDLIDTLDEIQQRLGGNPKQRYLSSSRKLRRDICDFADLCRCGELNGRARKRKSGELFRKIISHHPDVWSK